MKIVRFIDSQGQTHYGSPLGDDQARVLSGELLTGLSETDEVLKIERLLAPITPAAILCIGLNYREHAKETNAAIPDWPMVFMKNPASVAASGDPIVLPRKLRSDKVDYECELAIVIGKTCKNVSRENAFDAIFGYTCANDVSARDWQKEWGGGQFVKGKSFDSFCPLGPVLVTADEVPNPDALPIRTVINGETLQDSNTSDMIFSVAELVEFLSGSTTLLAGTLILTGTPQGVGAARKPPRFLQAGDEVVIEIDSIGRLSNPVIEETV
jgi:2-keto-4-pentenoate hydratase/2-oxohepta-3-ene-1,7-dioic acid hydratase in catechol pathway